ncbi:hypothetical protein LTR16_000148 [Cryomyces antarcticus]|uniref:Inner kinetochore subunit AME1 domain-containing protein n=1 Tax=Cryomyces antarcticus TaxID=329879 RepID=A0ABR0KUX2_9PEZI|nr:hypothetical protein LTR16_000148 [Cryomyces antarcticus]
MAPNEREQRRLERRRGAGTPGPLPPQPSSRKTPKTASKQISRQQILVTSQPQSKLATVRKTRSSSTPAPGRPKSSSSRHDAVHGTSAASGQPNYITPKVTGKRKRKGGSTRDVDDIEEDELDRDEGKYRASARRTATKGTSNLNIPRLRADTMRADADGDEDELDQDEEMYHLSGGVRRAGSQKLLSITAPIELIDSSNNAGKTIGVARRDNEKRKESADELTPVVKRARNKPGRPPTQLEAARTKATESEAEADELTPVTKRSQPESSRSKAQKASQRPPNVSRKPRAPKPANTPAVASPMPSRKAPPAAETAKRGQPIDAEVRPRKRSKPSTIASVPITVYRPSLPARPRASSPASSDDADPLSHHSSSAPTRTTVNGIDVLAQISTEIIERMASTLSLRLRSEPSVRARADGKRKRVALLAFGAELGPALFTLTGTVDAHAELGRRVKRAGKERVRLREELLGVRREREEVARRADEVRAAHEREVGEAREWQGLSKNLFDVELAVQRGREKAETEGRVGEGTVMGVENLVRGVVGDVVGGGGGRGEGLLGRIRKFNALLERAAEGLEGR